MCRRGVHRLKQASEEKLQDLKLLSCSGTYHVIVEVPILMTGTFMVTSWETSWKFVDKTELRSHETAGVLIPEVLPGL